MIGTIRRHSNVLWAIIIVAVIVSFVIYFTPTSKMGAGLGRDFDYGTVYGRKITRAEYVTAYNEAKLVFFVNSRRWPSSTSDAAVEGEMRRRLLLIENLKRNSIRADDTSVARQIRAYFPKKDGPGFEEADYKRFVKSELEQNGIAEEEFFEFVRHNLGQMHLIGLMGLPGRLSAPRGAETLFVRASQTVDADAAFFSRSNYLDTVKMDPSTITNYYSQQIEAYAIPERKQLTYVFFAATNYLAEADKMLAGVTNLEVMLEREYAEKGTNSFMDGTNVLTAAAAKAKIKESHRLEAGRVASQKAAIDFANKLYRMAPVNAANLATLAATNGLVVHETRPFSQHVGPSEIETPEIIAKTVWELTDKAPFSTPIVGNEGTYLLAYQKTVPREYPPFEALKARITEDYRRAQAQELTLQAGTAFAQAATNGIAQGKSFREICAAEKITPISVFAVSRQTVRLEAIENRVDLETFKDTVLEIPAGKSSPYHSSREGGFVVYVAKVTPPSESKLQEDFPKFVEEYRDEQQNVAYTEWFQHELMKSGLLTAKPGSRAAK